MEFVLWFANVPKVFLSVKKLKLSWPQKRASSRQVDDRFEPDLLQSNDLDRPGAENAGAVRRNLKSVYDDDLSSSARPFSADEQGSFKLDGAFSEGKSALSSVFGKFKRKVPLPEEEKHDLADEVNATDAPASPRQTAPAKAKKRSAGSRRQFEDESGWLVAQSLAKSFRRRPVVRDVTLAVRQGEAVGLLGPNGAGKTTVFYMITGLIRPDSGAIRIDGFNVTSLPMYARARLGVGYLPQEASIFRGLSVEDNIKAVLEIVEPSRRQRKEDLERLLEEFGIGHLRKSPSIALSGGERRRCEIARALASRPAFMLLDEPFAGIDPIAVGDIQQLVRQLTARGIGVLITDHNVRETLGLIDRAYIIHSGEVLMEGTPDDIVQNEDVRRVYLGDQFTL